MKATFLPDNGKKALFACVQGNHHAVGLRMVCDAVETLGWATRFLGADVPTADLLRMIDTERPELVCLSASMPEHLATARQIIALLHAELGSACPAIWVGGLATTGAQGVWRVSGADGYALDAEQVVQELR
jgi:methanogenic corrinoid protein MtbC1